MCCLGHCCDVIDDVIEITTSGLRSSLLEVKLHCDLFFNKMVITSGHKIITSGLRSSLSEVKVSCDFIFNKKGLTSGEKVITFGCPFYAKYIYFMQ